MSDRREGPSGADGADRSRGPELPPGLDPRGRRPSEGVPRVPRPAPDARGTGEAGRRLPPPTRPVPGPAAQVLPRGRRRTRQRVGRVLTGTAMVLSILMFAVTTVGFFAFRNYDGNITRLGPVSLRENQDRPAEAPRDARNILLIGSDTRDTTGAEFQGTGATKTAGQRADTIILAHLYGGSNAAQLVSFPRDSYVTIPEYTNPKTGEVTAEREGKINSAISEGGLPLLVDTLEKLSGLRVDDYVVIDFAGFQAMVNQLGGVEVCLLKDAKEPLSGIDLKAGRQTIEGAQALAFVRQRYGLPNGDIDRIGRQQHFIGSLTRKTLSAGTLLNPFKLNGFLDTATKNVSVSNGLSSTELVSLAQRLRSFSSGGVAFTTIPFTDTGARRDGELVVLLDMPKVETLFAGLRADRAPGELAAPAPAPDRAGEPTPTAAPAAGLFVRPDLIRVAVYNGAGTSGLGRRVADELATRGFQLPGSPANRGSGASTTVVNYGPDKADSARTLAASIPGSTLNLDPDLGNTLEVVAGSDYTGTVGVTIGAPPAQSAEPTPDATAPAAEVPLETAATAGCVN